jgi:pectin methylesterase-like acyl-CoA thioesterase
VLERASRDVPAGDVAVDAGLEAGVVNSTTMLWTVSAKRGDYIEGDVDFIFGRGTAVFDGCAIKALSRGSSSNNGYLTAASTADKNPCGHAHIAHDLGILLRRCASRS